MCELQIENLKHRNYNTVYGLVVNECSYYTLDTIINLYEACLNDNDVLIVMYVKELEESLKLAEDMAESFIGECAIDKNN